MSRLPVVGFFQWPDVPISRLPAAPPPPLVSHLIPGHPRLAWVWPSLPILIRAHPRQSAVKPAFPISAMTAIPAMSAIPSPSLGIPPHPRSSQIGVGLGPSLPILIRAHPRQSTVKPAFPISAMTAISKAARRKIAALQPVILKERPAFAANEGPKLAKPPRSPSPSRFIPLHPNLVWAYPIQPLPFSFSASGPFAVKASILIYQ